MSVSITLKIEHTVEGSEDTVFYRVACEVPATEGIDLALFAFKTEDDSYGHPATVRDLELFPDSKNEAVNNGLDYYRLASVTRDFDAMVDAIAFSTNVRTRLQYLANDLPITQEAIFEGVQTYTLVTSEN